MSTNKKFLIWILINLILPLTPFFLKIFINYFGGNGILTLRNAAESSELIFYSISICVVMLNINLDEPKSYFEFILNIFVYVILILDFVMLSLLYGKHNIKNIENFLFVSVLFPFISAPIYKFFYIQSPE